MTVIYNTITCGWCFVSKIKKPLNTKFFNKNQKSKNIYHMYAYKHVYACMYICIYV